MRGLLFVLLACCLLAEAAGWQAAPRACLRRGRPRCSALRAQELFAELPDDDPDAAALEAAYEQLEAEQEELGADDCECTGRIVTELVETGSNEALPDRFMFAMRAIRGEFTPEEGAADTERSSDAITAALLNFPTTVSLRVVTRPMASDADAEELVRQLNVMLETLEGADAPSVTVAPKPGNRRSLDFALRVPDAGALTTLREALREDERVQFVF